MLQEILIENFALIDKVQIGLTPGLNVLTGETGAGKSIIVDAMSFLLGGRAHQEYIRSGQDKAAVEGFFRCLDELAVQEMHEQTGLNPDEEGNLWLAREVSSVGRSTCRVNGRAVPLAVYQEAGRMLMDLHGQHEPQSLFSPAKQLLLLDNFGGQEVSAIKGQVAATYHELQQVWGELNSLKTKVHEKARQADFLQYQLQEIDGAKLIPGEDTILEQQKVLLSSVENLASGAARAYALLSNSESRGRTACDLLGQAAAILKDLTGIDPSLQSLAASVEGALYQAEDASMALRRYTERLDRDPKQLEEVDNRLELIRQVVKKYGGSIEAALQYRLTAAENLAEVQDFGARSAELEQKQSQLEDRYRGMAARLSEHRHRLAAKLADMMIHTLAELEMPRTKFEIRFNRRDTISSCGTEDLEFLLAANPGEPLRPLARVASGGELSRIMLAIKSNLAEVDRVPTLVFDEIDAGVGGRTAWSMAIHLARLAGYRQVICVSHLPQIAAFADSHFAIFKEMSGERTQTVVHTLIGQERVAELARMFGGEQQATAWQHAQALLGQAVEIKEGYHKKERL